MSSRSKAYVDQVATDNNARTYLHLRFNDNSIWCELTNAFKYNNVGKKTRLYSKAMKRDKFLVGNLLTVFG